MHSSVCNCIYLSLILFIKLLRPTFVALKVLGLVRFVFKEIILLS